MAERRRSASSAATGAVGTVTLELLARRGYDNVRVFASARSAGKQLGGCTVEEATPEALSRGDVDLFLFSVGTSASRELVPHAVAGGAVAIDKSSAYRLDPGIPLVVPEVNADRALEHDGIIANPNCCTIPLTCVLKPLHDAAGLVRVRVATYQSVSGAGAQSMERLRNEPPAEHDLRMDWEFDGEEFDEESKLRAETQKIMELPELPIQATCVRVPVMVGHAEAVWIETEDELTPEQAQRAARRGAVGARSRSSRRRARPPAIDEVLVGRIRRDPTVERGLALFLASDNLRKGAALNAIQIAELVLRASAQPLPEPSTSACSGGSSAASAAATGGRPRTSCASRPASGFDTVQIRSDRAGRARGRARHRPGRARRALRRRRPRAGARDARASRGRARHARRALRANLAAIEAIGFLRVHIHPVGAGRGGAATASPTSREALEVAEDAGLILGVEHNAPGHRLLVEPDAMRVAPRRACRASAFVWDVNHTPTEHAAALPGAARADSRLVHVSDTPLPETNHHLPLGRGNVDFSVLDGIEDVPFILEIGGLPAFRRPGPRHGRGAARLARAAQIRQLTRGSWLFEP